MNREGDILSVKQRIARAMKSLFISMWITGLITCYPLYSQQIDPVEKWMEYIEETAGEDEDSRQAELLYDELSYLSAHPANLNTATAEQLRKLPFLTDLQVTALLDYRRRYGELCSIYELKGIKEIDRRTLGWLLPFVYVAPGKDESRTLNFKNIKKYGRSELAIRFDRCLQEKKGYQPVIDTLSTTSSGSRYLGEPFYQALRYSFACADWLQAGFTAEKDAGEPFLKSVHRGYDFYSVHLLLRDRGVLKTWVGGDYKASFGQGLLFSQGFTPGRGVLVTQAERRDNGFRRHYSTGETGFLRGTAATLAWKNWEASGFYSGLKTDATVEGDAIRSFLTDGLHRTPGEREKRHTVVVRTVGAHLRYVSEKGEIGCTGVYTSFGGKTVDPVPKPYNLFYFRGKEAIGWSIDYRWKTKYAAFYGEASRSGRHAWAVLQGCRLAPASFVSLLVLYRSYSKRYTAFYGNAYRQNTAVTNEEGIYVGMELTPSARWKLSGYADLFRFPWLLYGTAAPAAGKEYKIQAEYTPAPDYSFSLRYRCRDKAGSRRGQARLQVAGRPAPSFSWQLAADGVAAGVADGAADRGWMISQKLGWSPEQLPFRADLYLGCFRTGSYASRIYSYEKNLLYAFSLPACYGKGIRWAATVRADLWKNLSVSVKVAGTNYTGRETVGSGPEEIQGAVKTDIYALLRWKF